MVRKERHGLAKSGGLVARMVEIGLEHDEEVMERRLERLSTLIYHIDQILGLDPAPPDFAAEKKERDERAHDKIALEIIDKKLSRGAMDGFDFLAALARLAQSGKIVKKSRGGW
jgi:hypothetical protein